MWSMSSFDHSDVSRRPTLSGTMLVLLGILVLYPLAGWLLTLLATGGLPLERVLRHPTASLLHRMLLAQLVGQMLTLALPVMLLATRWSGGWSFGRVNLRWLGVGKGGGWRPALLGGVGMVLLQPVLYTIVEAQTRLLPMLGQTGRVLLQEQEQLDRFIRLLAGELSLRSVLAASLVFVLTPAICEELLFRGYVQKSLALNIKPGRAVLFTGVVFALFHMEWFNLLPLTLLGWYIGYLYLKTDNLLVPAVAHGVNNLGALGMVYFGGGQAQSGYVAASSPVSSWLWWVLVVVTLFSFSLLIRFFSDNLASGNAKKPMPDGR